MTSIIIPTDAVLEKLGPNGEHWLKGSWESDGKLCLHQGIRACMPEPGDAFVVEQVAQRQGWGTDFNDDDDTGWADVAAALAAHREITEADLLEAFGPNWALVRARVNQVATLTAEQVAALDAAWGAPSGGTLDAAWRAGRGAAWRAGRGDVWDATLDATWGAAWRPARRPERRPAWSAARGAKRGAAWSAAASCVLDLIGRHRFTQEHYDTLMGPWLTVFPETTTTEATQ